MVEGATDQATMSPKTRVGSQADQDDVLRDRGVHVPHLEGFASRRIKQTCNKQASQGQILALALAISGQQTKLLSPKTTEDSQSDQYDVLRDRGVHVPHLEGLEGW